MTPPVNQQLCDYCSDRSAVLYCRADSAKLCLLCDREVHSTNQLFSKHSRSQLCDRCSASSASIFCETDRSVFCSNCDWENHSLSTLSVHNRRPIDPFTGCPSVTDLLTALGFDDFDTKSLLSSDENATANEDDEDGFKEFFDWGGYHDFVSLDNLIVPSDASHNYQALHVPPLPKNRNATCGRQKEEILHQLGQLAKLEPNFSSENADIDTSIGFHPLVPELNRPTAMPHDPGQNLLPDHELDGAAQLFTDALETKNQLTSTLLPNKLEERDQQLETSGQANDSCDPITAEVVPTFPKVNSHEINTQERDSAISRYKEKRKTRRYDKHIRYESRKVRAESRTRIKGRFAKIEH